MPKLTTKLSDGANAVHILISKTAAQADAVELVLPVEQSVWAVYGEDVAAPPPPPAPPAPPAVTPSTVLIGQGGKFTLTEPTAVKYGADDKFFQKTLLAGEHPCTDGYFGDPAPGAAKSCRLVGTDAASPPQSTNNAGTAAAAPAPIIPSVFITGQGGTINLTEPRAVMYGNSAVGFFQKTLLAGSHPCSDSYFGDPASGSPKSCYFVGTDIDAPPQSANKTGTAQGTTAPAPAPAPTPAPSTDAAWLAMADNMHTLAGLEYRFGKKSTKTQTLPTLQEATHKLMPMGDIRGYEFGTFKQDAGDFASNVLHATFLPDNPNIHFGVSDLQGTSSGHYTLSVRPEFSWTRYIRNDGDERYNGMELRRMRDSQGVQFKNIVCSAQAHGRPGWQTMSLHFWEDGTYGTLGANTMTNKTWGRLPAHLKPVAAAISSSNEFCVVLVRNKLTKTTEIAGISLVGLGDGRTVANPDFPGDANDEGWWGERQEPQPGMNNLGNIAFAKYLGTSPCGLKSATTISFTTGHPRHGYLNGSGAPIGLDGTTGNTAKWKYSEQQRQDWATGKFSNRYARQGLILVGSKDDSAVALIDASPLFRYINKMYFGSRDQFMLTTNVGQGDDQWPYSYAKAPEQMPTVAKIISSDSPVTSVFITPISNRVEFYAIYGTLKGEAHVITLGGFPGAVDPTKWVETDKLQVGGNLTSISQVREKANGLQTNLVADVMQQYTFVSREDNALTWLDIYGGKITFRRRMQNSRIVDMIAAQDYDNHGTEQYVVAIADFTGKKVHNVLWGPMIMHTYPNKPRFDMQPAGAEFMDGGSMDMPGFVFGVCTANIS